MSCDCCTEAFNKTTRKKVETSCCNFNVCRGCVIRYFMTNIDDAKCMNCNVRYTDEVLDENFTKTWINKDKLVRDTNIIFNIQKSKLNETIPFVDISKQISRANVRISDIDRQLVDLRKTMDYLTQQRRIEFRAVNNLERSLYGDNEHPVEVEKREFIFNCPDNECKGFLSTRYKCKLCEKNVCDKCHKIKDQDHTCNDDDIKSVIEIKKSTKPCPKCGTRIQKSEGCPQMFCTNPGCGTVFDWNTLEIQHNGVVHNPHVAEYNRLHGTTIGSRNNANLGLCNVDADSINIICNSIINTYRRHSIDHTIYFDYQVTQFLFNAVAFKNHIRYVEINRTNNWFNNHLDNDFKLKLRDLRIKYLLKIINDDQWFTEIRKIQRKLKIRNEFREIFNMGETIINDILREDLGSYEVNKNFNSFNHDRYKNAFDYIQNQLNKINKRYNIKGKNLPDRWGIYHWKPRIEPELNESRMHAR